MSIYVNLCPSQFFASGKNLANDIKSHLHDSFRSSNATSDCWFRGFSIFPSYIHIIIIISSIHYSPLFVSPFSEPQGLTAPASPRQPPPERWLHGALGRGHLRRRGAEHAEHGAPCGAQHPRDGAMACRPYIYTAHSCTHI